MAFAPLPQAAAESYRELATIDGAKTLRRVKRGRLVELVPEALDIEILLLVSELGSLLSSQIHRRFNPGRAATTTQRRLKRLADAGLVERVQFHGADGGGAPMGYSLSAAGRRLLEDRGQDLHGAEASAGAGGEGGSGEALIRARREIHVAAWALALMSLGGTRASVWGAPRSVLQPPRPRGPQGGPLTPATLSLPGGRVAHDFLQRRRGGEIVEAERFDSIRPQAIVGLAATQGARSIDVLIELDDRHSGEGWVAKLERYDHFLSGWSEHIPRYGPSGRAAPLVIFICADRRRARAVARAADPILTAAQAYAGDYPSAWHYHGRERILFVGERDLHEGLRSGWAVAPQPPSVRQRESDLDGPAGLRLRSIPLPGQDDQT